jgi:hypothetical protein
MLACDTSFACTLQNLCQFCVWKIRQLSIWTAVGLGRAYRTTSSDIAHRAFSEAGAGSNSAKIKIGSSWIDRPVSR